MYVTVNYFNYTTEPEFNKRLIVSCCEYAILIRPDTPAPSGGVATLRCVCVLQYLYTAFRWGRGINHRGTWRGGIIFPGFVASPQ